MMCHKFSIFKIVLVSGDPKGEHSGRETAVDPPDASANPGHLLWVELGAGHLANPLRPSGQGQHHQPEEQQVKYLSSSEKRSSTGIVLKIAPAYLEDERKITKDF